MHIDTQTLIAAGIGAHLMLSLAKLLFRRPQDQEKIDALGRKADSILAEVQAVSGLLNPPKGGR